MEIIILKTSTKIPLKTSRYETIFSVWNLHVWTENMGFAFNVSTHVATGTIGVDDLALDAVAVKIAAVMCAAVRL